MSKLVTYDLCTPGKDYPDLTKAIKAYSDCCKVTESCWIISTDDSCITVRDNLKKHIDANDRLFVASLTGEGAWINVLCSNDKLKEII